MEERMSDWRPIETAPHGVDVLLYCPERGISNPERIELGAASTGWTTAFGSTVSYHGWATMWQPLPAMPLQPTPPQPIDGGE
jgi:hypothetical protein